MTRIAPSRAALLLAPFALAAFGCKGNSIEGTWKDATPAVAGVGDLTFTFHGGVMTTDLSINQPMIGTIKVHGTGTYKLEGDTLTTNVADVKIDSSGATAIAKGRIDSPEAKAQMKAQMNQNETAKIKFDSSNQILLTSNGKSQTLTRVP